MVSVMVTIVRVIVERVNTRVLDEVYRYRCENNKLRLASLSDISGIDEQYLTIVWTAWMNLH